MIYVGMDIHKRFSQVAVLDESGEVLDQRRLTHTPCEELRNYFNQFPKDTQVIMEPTCGWNWLSDRISDLGLEVILAHPLKVRLIAESQIKTDKVDAVALAQLHRTGFLPQAKPSHRRFQCSEGHRAVRDAECVRNPRRLYAAIQRVSGG